MKRWIARAMTLALAAVGFTACRGSMPAGDLPPVQVTVTNDLGRGIASIFVVPEFGVPRLIGSVDTQEQVTLTYDAPTVAERLRLRAVIAGVGEVISDPFIIPQNARAVWTLRNNRVTTPARESPPPAR